MINTVFTVKLLDFPIFNKVKQWFFSAFKKNSAKKEKQDISLNLPKGKIIEKLKTKYLVYIASLLIFIASLGVYLVFNNYFSDYKLFETNPSVEVTPEATPEATPRPTPKPLPTGKQIYRFSHGSNVVGPKPTEAIIDPIDPKQGDTQTLTLTIPHSKPITDIQATLLTDNQQKTLILSNTQSDQWQVEWKVEDTYDYTYQIQFSIADDSETFSGALTFR